jgi:hypothetical protein
VSQVKPPVARAVVAEIVGDLSIMTEVQASEDATEIPPTIFKRTVWTTKNLDSKIDQY